MGADVPRSGGLRQPRIAFRFRHRAPAVVPPPLVLLSFRMRTAGSVCAALIRITSAAMPVSSGVSAPAAELAPRVSMRPRAYHSVVGFKTCSASALTPS
jgi:hypothetical protein